MRTIMVSKTKSSFQSDRHLTVSVIFDLDGTLLDTSPGILECVRYTADRLGYPALSMDQLLTFIGPPLKESFVRCYGCSEEEAAALTAAYRVHYREGALLHAEPYAGIFELCDALKKNGFQLAVATNKPNVFSEQILRHFGFDRYITVIHGADMEGKLSKADLIRRCVEHVGNGDPSACVMIGDSEIDAKGAYEAGVPFIGVSYGFGNIDEMKKYPYIGIVGAPLEILDIIRTSL